MDKNMHEATFITYGCRVFDYEFIKNSENLSVVSFEDDEKTINVLLTSVMAGLASYIINDMASLKEDMDMSSAMRMLSDSKDCAIKLGALRDDEFAESEIRLILDKFYGKYPFLVNEALEHSMDKTMTPIYILSNTEDVNIPELKQDVDNVGYMGIFDTFEKSVANTVAESENRSIIHLKKKKFPIFDKTSITVNEFLSIEDEDVIIAIGKFLYEEIEDIKIGQIVELEKGNNNDEEFDSDLKEAFIDTMQVVRVDPIEMDYIEADKYHGEMNVLQVKEFNADSKDMMPRLALNIEIQKSNTYKIETTQMDERRNVMIELERLFKKDYPESLHFLENRVQGMSIEELKDMLNKLS